MPPVPVRLNADALSLAARVFQNATVVASPSGATITTVASLTIDADLQVTEGVLLFGYAAFTVGTAGVSVLAEIRRTNTTGTLIKASGAITVVAAELHDTALVGFDTGPTLPGQVYVLCLTVASASAESAVSAVTLAALVV